VSNLILETFVKMWHFTKWHKYVLVDFSNMCDISKGTLSSFHGNSGYANASQCSVIRAFVVFFMFDALIQI
jgi:hypothetical protein